MEVSYWILFIIGAASWLAGGILFGLNRGMHWLSSLALHLIPVVGLILMALLRRNLTPHEAWSRSHRGQVNEASLRRNYRQMKSLY